LEKQEEEEEKRLVRIGNCMENRAGKVYASNGDDSSFSLEIGTARKTKYKRKTARK